MISKIERGKLYPTLPTLLRLALVFSVGLDFFFSRRDDPTFEVMRKSERLRFPEDPESPLATLSYHFESLDYKATDRRMSAYLAEFKNVTDDAAAAHAHDRNEFIYLISGTLEVTYGEDKVVRLESGDSAYFDSTIHHSYRKIGKHECQAVLVTLP